MFAKKIATVLLVSAFVAPSIAHPHLLPRAIIDVLAPNVADPNLQVEPISLPFSAAKFPAVQTVLEGNKRFQQNRDSLLMDTLVAEGQKPSFMMMSCADSRAPEATIFDSAPGTFFMQRNIANQYKPGDVDAQSVLAYGITVLGVQHIVVMGHYGCGGVAASILPPPKHNVDVATSLVQTWIGDIRQLYLSSNRTEIQELRAKNEAIEATGGTIEEPEIEDPGFRALVEENVKQQVKRISDSSVMSNVYDQLLGTNKTSSLDRRAEEVAEIIPVFVHGWVHDLQSGEVIDLNISTGPPGFEDFVPSNDGEAIDPPLQESPVLEEPQAITDPATGEEFTLRPISTVPVRLRRALANAFSGPAGKKSRRTKEAKRGAEWSRE